MDTNNLTDSPEITESERDFLWRHASIVLEEYYTYLHEEEESRLRQRRMLQNTFAKIREEIRKESVTSEQALDTDVSAAAQEARHGRKQAHREEKRRSRNEKPPEECVSASMAEPPWLLDDSFSEKMVKLMEEKHLTGPDVYKKADVGRDVFSRLLSARDYRPSKGTAISIALALRLTLPEAEDLLDRAGYSLSRSILGDVAIRHCFEEEIFDVIRVNILLDDLECPLLSRVRY